MANPFDQFDQANPFDAFDEQPPEASIGDLMARGYYTSEAGSAFESAGRQLQRAKLHEEPTEPVVGAYGGQFGREPKAYSVHKYNPAKALSLKLGAKRDIASGITSLAEASKLPESKALKRISQAEGFGSAVSEFANAPVDTIIDAVAQSAYPMAKTIAAAAVGGTLLGPAGAIGGAGATSFTSNYDSKFLEKLVEKGVDLRDEKAVFNALSDKRLVNEAANSAFRYATPIAAMDALTMGVAGKVLSPSRLKNIALQTGVQAGGGAGGEALGQLAEAGKITSPGEVLTEAVAELPGGISDVMLMKLAGAEPTVQTPIATPPAPVTAQDVLQQATIPQRGTAQDIIAQQAGIRPPPTPQETAARAEDVQAAMAEPYGRVLGEGQVERVMTQGEYADIAAIDALPATPDQPLALEYKPDQMIVFPDGTTLPASGLADVWPALSIEERARMLNMAQQPAAPKAEEVIAQATVPQRATTQEIVGEQAGIKRPASKKKVAARMKDVQAAMAEPYGRVLGEGQVERVMTQGEYEQAAATPTVTPEAQVDRRKNIAKRRKVEEMSPEEMRKALKTDELTGLGNRRAYEEAEPAPMTASIDADSLKWINDNMSPQAGDQMLQHVGDALAEIAPDQSYRVSGDEFIITGATTEQLQQVMSQVKDKLKTAEITETKPSGEKITKKGVDVTYGLGATKKEADFDLKQQKQTREETGKRAGRGEEPPGVTKELSNYRGTLYSGIPLDPLVDAVKSAMKILGMDNKFVDRWKDRWSETTEAFTGDFGHRPPWQQLGHMARIIGYSNDGVLEYLARKYDSPTIDKIRRMLWSPAGPTAKGKETGLTWQDAVSRRSMTNLNKMAKLLGPVGRDESALKQVTKLIQNPDNIRPGTPIHDAAKGLSELLADELQYQKEAGVDIGEVSKGYFPRQMDTIAVSKDQGGFLAAAKRAYKDTYGSDINDKQADEMARAWMRVILLADIGVRADATDFVQIGGVPVPSHTKVRTLSKNADAILAKYMMTNPVDVLSSYFTRSSRRAEWERRFGGDKWAELRAQMEEEGAYGAIDSVVKAIQSSTGNTPGAMTMDTGNVVSWLRTWTALTFLPRATFTSLSEIAMTAVRTGDARTLARNLVTTTKSLFKTHDTEELRVIAEEIFGLTGQIANDMLMSQRFGGQVDSKAAQHITNRFFYRTGLHQWTEATRVAALDVGQWYFKRLAGDIVNNTKRRKSSEMALRELGVTDTKAFAEAISPEDVNMMTAQQLSKRDKITEQYKTAMQRFVDQTIMNPKAVERPRYANTPVGSLAYALLSFIYSFHKNVLVRSGKMAGEAVTGKGYTAADRLAMAAPALMLTLPVLLQLGLGELRDEIYKDPNKKKEPKTLGDKVLTALSRAGLFGAFDPLANIYTSAKYEREPATVALGPLLGLMSEMFMGLVTLKEKNSENTNTAERNAAKHFYNLFIAPAGNLAGTLIPGGLTGAAAIQGSSHPYMRNAFMDWLAGPKESKKRGRSSTGRDTGRSATGGRGGRSSTR